MKTLTRRSALTGLAALPLLLCGNSRPAVSIGLFSKNRRPQIPADVEVVLSEGHHRPGVGIGFYSLDARVDAQFNERHPNGSFIAADGRGFRLGDRIPNPYQFGAIGDGTLDDEPAWRALCAFATEVKLPRITLGSATLGGQRPFILPLGIDVADEGGKFMALSPFSGGEVVSTPAGVLYLNTHLATVRADVANLRNVEGGPISAFRFRWIGYVKADRLEGENVTGHGLVVEPGDQKSFKGATRDLFCDFVEMRASKRVDPSSSGVVINGSDHAFRFGTCVGFPIGGSSPGANNFLGIWHVWSSYHEGWPQMRLGWDASGEGNQGTIEVDSPGAVDRSRPTSLENGPVGVHLHANGIRNDLKIIVNVSNWGSSAVKPRPGSIVPVLIAQSRNKVTVDVVDYAERSTGKALVAKPWVAFSEPRLASTNTITAVDRQAQVL